MVKRLNQLSDEAIMTSVAKGNLEDMRLLFDRYHTRIYNYLLSMSNNEVLSQDICQEVFYKALKYRTSYRGTHFLPWIFRIASNLYIDHYQQQKQQRNELAALVEHLHTDWQKEVKQEELLERLYWALDQLNVQDRNLIVMNRLQGIKYQDIAEIVGSNTGAVRTRIHRIINVLRIHYFNKNEPE